MSPQRRNVLLAIGFVFMLVLAGCTGAELADGPPDTTEPSDAVQQSADVDDTAADADDGGQHVIRTGTVHVEVEEFEASRASLRTLAAERGGYIQGSDRNVHRDDNRTWTTGTLVIRVPDEEFDDVHEAVGEEGIVIESSTVTEDVTEQVVDLEARIENLEAQRDRLRDLYEDANETSDVLQIESQLSSVQEDIERTEAQLRVIENRVSYATITVYLAEPEPGEVRPEIEAEDAWHEAGLIEAFMTSVSALGTAARMSVVALAYLAPVAVVFTAPIAGLYLVVRWVRN